MEHPYQDYSTVKYCFRVRVLNLIKYPIRGGPYIFSQVDGESEKIEVSLKQRYFYFYISVNNLNFIFWVYY